VTPLTTAFSTFITRLQVQRQPAPSTELAALWGTSLAPSLVQLIDTVGAQPAHARADVGPLCTFALPDLLPHRTNAFDFMIAQPFRLTALLSSTMAVGTTGGGAVWLVEIESHDGAHRVFLEDHDTGDIVPIASSLEHFSLLCLLLDGGADDDDERWRELASHVRRANDVPVPRHLPAWQPTSTVPERFAGHSDVQRALAHGHDVDDRGIDVTSVAACIASAVRLFLRGDDDALRVLLPTLRAHPARLVQDAAVSLSRKLGHDVVARRSVLQRR
jgi:hypothetical protein